MTATKNRLAAVVVALICAFALVACSAPADDKAPAQGEQGTTTTETRATDGPTTNVDTNQTSQKPTQAESGKPAAPDKRAAEFAVDPARTDWNFDAPAKKTVYLTFDDGPSENTQAVLDILDKYGIKATFFVTGINPDYLPMIGKCYERGHTIGLHTYSHQYDQVYASVDAYWNDLNRIGSVVEKQIGYVPCFIRFPGGSSNTISADYTTGIMSVLADEVVAAGYQYFDWDASCGDGATHTADELVEASKADTAYGYQSIVFLMHDGAQKETTVEALPRIIEYFKSEGYEFAPIDRSTCVPHHGIGN